MLGRLGLDRSWLARLAGVRSAHDRDPVDGRVSGSMARGRWSGGRIGVRGAASERRPHALLEQPESSPAETSTES